MTEFTQTTTSTEKTPFVKLGLFDENNYTPAKLKDAKEKEAKYKPIRLIGGDKLSGTITSFWGDKNGPIMYLKDVEIVTASGVIKKGLIKIGLSHDLNYKVLEQQKKVVGDKVVIEYIGLTPSIKDASRNIHKVNVA